MNNETFVSMDNLMGLLPENIALKVDEMMHGRWDHNGYAFGSTVFAKIIQSYGELGLCTNTNREWQTPDIMELLNQHLYVTNS